MRLVNWRQISMKSENKRFVITDERLIIDFVWFLWQRMSWWKQRTKWWIVFVIAHFIFVNILDFFVEWTFICEKLLWKMNRIWTWKHFVIWCNCEWIDIEFIASKCEMFWLLESMWNAKTVWSDGRNNELDVHKLWLLVKCSLFLFILSFHIQNTL